MIDFSKYKSFCPVCSSEMMLVPYFDTISCICAFHGHYKEDHTYQKWFKRQDTEEFMLYAEEFLYESTPYKCPRVYTNFLAGFTDITVREGNPIKFDVISLDDFDIHSLETFKAKCEKLTLLC